MDALVTHWECPNCSLTDVTRGLYPNRFHACPGLTAPMTRAGTRAKVAAEERQDYLNGEIRATGIDDGKPCMAVRVTRDDGEDLAVNAGLAILRLGDSR